MNRAIHIFFFLIILTCATYAQPVRVVTDADVSGTATFWSADTIYHLDGYIFIPADGALTIEAGTVIKGLNTPSTGDKSSALIVARGAQIFAVGTADHPIIFTAEFDDPNVPDDLTKDDKGLWGGLIVLGEGVVGVNGGVQNIEGIPTTEGRAEYGGTDNTDDSGILRYVSIRHGGSKLEANNEINGLTLGGVGSETEIDFIEIYANLDDGIEWFGGAVNVSHAVVAFCGDDSFDYDQSWGGKGQFWFSLQDELSNRAGEWDGSEAANLEPKVSPTISNITAIGAGPVSMNEDNNDAFRIRDDAAAHVYNSIITGFARDAIVIDNDNPGADSWDRYLAGDLTFNNNVIFDMGGGASLDEVVNTDGGGDAAFVADLVTRGNVFADPSIAGISREPNGGLDPRINGDGAAYEKGSPVGDAFFENVNYIGAFDSENNWAMLWTALDDAGFFGDLVSATDDPVLSDIDETMKVYPNPASSQLDIDFNLNQSQSLSLAIIDITGKVVSQMSPAFFRQGKNKVSLEVRDLVNGTYIIALNSDKGIVARRLVQKQ